MTVPAPLAGRIEAVVIGASAGGVEALSLLLPSLPAGMRAAVFVVLHIPRERPSLLVDIFAPRCAVAVAARQAAMAAAAAASMPLPTATSIP